MRWLLSLVLVVVPISVSAETYNGQPNYYQGIDTNGCPEFFPGSITSDSDDLVTICRLNYAVIYDTKCKIPVLAFENLVASEVDGVEPRVDRFRADPGLLPEHAARLKDYEKSGYDRGHMVPVADMSEDSVSQLQTYYLSNIVPQNPNFNRGIWRRLEQYVRDIVASRGDRPTYIMTGAILPRVPKTIGDGVCVPVAMFKSVFTEHGGLSYAMANRSNQRGYITDYLTTHQIMLDVMGFELVR